MADVYQQQRTSNNMTVKRSLRLFKTAYKEFVIDNKRTIIHDITCIYDCH